MNPLILPHISKIASNLLSDGIIKRHPTICGRFHLLQVIIIVAHNDPYYKSSSKFKFQRLKLLSAILGGIIVGAAGIFGANQISRELANFQKNRRETKKRVSTILASYRKLLG